jgi:SAM-dependent methyltransferase
MYDSPTRTSTTTLVQAGLVNDTTNPFALPRGLKGRLAGWYMGHLDVQHRELLELLAPHLRGDQSNRVLEVGFGPGQVLARIRRQNPSISLLGVDPSEIMVHRARRRVGNADLRLGAAASIPFDDRCTTVVVSINNVPMWPDLDAGFAESRRVLASGGRLIVAWHGGTDPRGHQRQLVLPTEGLNEITAAAARHFAVVDSREVTHSHLWELA